MYDFKTLSLPTEARMTAWSQTGRIEIRTPTGFRFATEEGSSCLAMQGDIVVACNILPPEKFIDGQTSTQSVAVVTIKPNSGQYLRRFAVRS